MDPHRDHRLALAVGELGTDQVGRWCDPTGYRGPRLADLRPDALLAGILTEILRRGRERRPVADTAPWAITALARGIGLRAVELAREYGHDTVVASGGGLAEPWVRHVLHRTVTGAGLGFHASRNMPCGDAGIALGLLALTTVGSIARGDATAPSHSSSVDSGAREVANRVQIDVARGLEPRRRAGAAAPARAGVGHGRGRRTDRRVP